MQGWKKLKVLRDLKIKASEVKLFSEMLPAGLHSVVIDSAVVEETTNTHVPYIKVVFKNEDYQKQFSSSVWFLSKDGDNCHYVMSMFLQGISKKLILQDKLFEFLIKEPSNANALVGLKMKILIKAPTEGVKIIQKDGIYSCVSCVTDENLFPNKEFSDIEDLKSHIEIFNNNNPGEMLIRKYSEIKRYIWEHDNDTAIHSITAEKATKDAEVYPPEGEMY